MVILPHRRKAFRTVPESGGGGGDSDPNFANVSALLHMQGANNGTTFIDSSSNALTCTAFGNAKTITSDFKWGNSCGNFDGSGDYLTIAASSGMDFGTGDYTIELWAKWTSVGGAQILVDIGNGATYFRVDSGNTLYVHDSGAFVIFAAAIPTFNTSSWYHLALVRSGTARNFYVDGSLVATGTRSGSAGSAGISTKVGARFDSALAYNGKMQDLRITKAIARDVSTVPTAQFPDS